MAPRQSRRLERGFALGLAVLVGLPLSGCATLMTEKSQTVRVTTDPPGRTLQFEGQSVADGGYVTVRRRFKTPRFEPVASGDGEPISMEYSPEPWLLGDVGLAIFFIIPGVIAGGIDAATGAWRKLDDPQRIRIPAQRATESSRTRGKEEDGRSETKKPEPKMKTLPSPEESERTSSPEARSEPKSPEPAPAEAEGWRRTSSVLPAPEDGIVSWYQPEAAGTKTASGQPFDPEALAGAHRSLPFGTLVRVTRLDVDRSVEVTINDRRPQAEGRVIDLTRGAAEVLGILDRGIAPCRVEVLSLPETERNGSVR